MKRDLNLVRFYTVQNNGFVDTVVHEGKVVVQVYYTYKGEVVNTEITKI